MRLYEVGFVVAADAGAESIAEQIDEVKRWITNNGGNVQYIDQWGRRRLAYPIEGKRDGFYVFMYADIPAEGVLEVERNLRLSEDILRFLVIRPNA